VLHASFSHDSRYLASVGTDDTIRIWDVESGRQQYLFESDGGTFTTYAFSQDDTYLAAGNISGSIQVWDLETGLQHLNLLGHAGSILSVIFGPDDEYLASGSVDNTIRTWDIKTGEQLDEYCEALCSDEDDALFGGVSHIVFSPDGKYSASYAGLLEFIIRTLPDGEERILSYGGQLGHTSNVSDLVFSTNSRYLSAFGTIGSSWNVETLDAQSGFNAGDIPSFMRSNQYVVSSFQAQNAEQEILSSNFFEYLSTTFVHPQNQYYATMESDNTVHIMEKETGEEINILRGHRGTLTSVAFSPNGRYLATASEDNTIRLWQGVLLADKGPKVYDFRATPDSHLEFTGISFSEDGRYLATGRDSVIIWELATGEQLQVFVEDMLWDSFSRLRLIQDGSLLLGATPGTQTFQRLVVWEVATGNELCRMEDHSLSGISPNGQYFAIMDAQNQISVFEAATCQEIHTIENPTPDELAASGDPVPLYEKLSFSLDNTYLAALDSAERVIHIWEVESGKLVETLTGTADLTDPWSELTFDLTGQYITSPNFGTIPIWDRETGQLMYTLGTDLDRFNDFDFSPDGRYLVTVGEDRMVRLWEIASGEEQLVMRGHANFVNSVAYSADGRFLASMDSETIRIWNAETGDELYSFDLSGSGDYIEFSPLGDYLILVTESGAVHVWYFDAVEAMLADAMKRIGPTLQNELSQNSPNLDAN
jgi:WD40 repeat protein